MGVKRMKIRNSVKRIAVFALLLTIGISWIMPLSVHAQEEEQKVVRVGWYESTYCYRDSYGRRRGMAYEYQQKIAAHTGWKYEYVEDSWPNLLQMLMDGEIDLLSDVSYTKERTDHMLFPALPMGSESYYLYVDADNTVITQEDLSSLNGKKIGVNKGSFQVDLLRDWADQYELSVNIVELTNDETYFMSMLADGKIDALVSMDSVGAEERVIPVCKIGASDYFFAVNKQRSDLLAELNSALSAIQDEDPFYNQKIAEEYVNLLRTNAFITPVQDNWLKEHGTIRVGYREDYLPFCATDKKTGELTGALKDYLVQASNCLKNADIRFEAVPYSTTDDALAAMKDGEIDCVFPVNLSSYDGEEKGVLTISPIMRTEMNLLMRDEEQENRTGAQDKTVAIEEGNTNFETFVKDNFPTWTIMTCSTAEDCFRAVRNGTADGVLESVYRMNVYEPLRVKYKLVTVPIGDTMELTFAVSSDNHTLYSILNKIVNLTPEEDMQYALSSYLYSTKKVSFLDFLEDNWIGVLLFITAVFAVLLFLLYKKLNAERQVKESLRRELSQKEQLESVTQIAYSDSLTGVKSKHAFVEAEEQMDRRIEEKTLTEFAMVLFDLNDLKVINDNKGHQEGDEYIKEACRIICTRFKHSPVYRIGGDEFVAVLEGTDYHNRDELLAAFEKQMDANLTQGRISIASGCACFDPSSDKSSHSVLERADERMYQRKNQMKDAVR